MISIVNGKTEISLNLQGVPRLQVTFPCSQPTNEGAPVVYRFEPLEQLQETLSEKVDVKKG